MADKLASYALTSRSRLLDFLGITTPLTTAQGEMMDYIINQVSSFIQNYTGRTFKEATYTNELIDGAEADNMMLKNFPVSSADAFTLQSRNTPDNSDDWSTIDSEDYFVDYDTGIIYTTGRKFLKTRRGYRASYTAGYEFNNSSTFLSDFQKVADIESVTWMIGSLMWHKKKGDPSITGERINKYQVTYGIQGLLFQSPNGSMMQGILDNHKRGDNNYTTVMTPSNTSGIAIE